MTARPLPPSLWDLIASVEAEEGVQTLHLAVGKPPLVRIEGEGLRPIHESDPPLTNRDLQIILDRIVDPDHWNRLESMGEGDLSLVGGTGRPIRLSLFRNTGAWSAVVHL